MIAILMTISTAGRLVPIVMSGLIISCEFFGPAQLRPARSNNGNDVPTEGVVTFASLAC